MVTEGPDFPPVTPLLARLSELIFGGSLAGFRVLPALAGAAIVVLAGLLALELGGGRAAQVLAGLAVLGSPMFLGANALLQTVTFDQLAWVVVLFLLTRLLRTDDPRWWPAVGAAVGVGLQTKFTMFTLASGIAVGVLATPVRRHLRTPWPWLAATLDNPYGVANEERGRSVVVCPSTSVPLRHWPRLRHFG